MNLMEFLVYASGPGVNAVVGFLLAFALELWPGFEALAPRVKRLATMGLCFVVPLAAVAGLWVLQQGWTQASYPYEDQVWNALQAGFLAFFGSQAGHATLLPAAGRPPLVVSSGRSARS